MIDTTGVEIRLAAVLRPLANEQERVQAPAATVGQTLDWLVSTFPQLRDAIYASPGLVSPFLGLFVDDEDVRLRGGLECRLVDGQVLSILPALSGG